MNDENSEQGWKDATEEKSGGTTEVNHRDKSQFMSTNQRDLCETLIAFYQTLVQM